MRACGCDHAAPPSAGWDESGSPEGAMTSLNGGPPLAVSGADRPAAAEHLHLTARWLPACLPSQLDIAVRRSQPALINFVFESSHRFPRGFNVNDFHRFPPSFPLTIRQGESAPASKLLGDGGENLDSRFFRVGALTVPSSPAVQATLFCPSSRNYSCRLSSVLAVGSVHPPTGLGPNSTSP